MDRYPSRRRVQRRNARVWISDRQYLEQLPLVRDAFNRVAAMRREDRRNIAVLDPDLGTLLRLAYRSITPPAVPAGRTRGVRRLFIRACSVAGFNVRPFL